MTEADPTPFTVFVSYAHADDNDDDVSKRWLHRLRVQLAPLVRQNKVAVWSDKGIETGQEWEEEIAAAMRGAKAAVLLVGPEFLASEFIAKVEVPTLLERADTDGLLILPVILDFSLFTETEFNYPDPKNGPKKASLSKFQSVNSPQRPLVAMSPSEQGQVFLSVARMLQKIVSVQPPPEAADEGATDEHVRAVEGALDLLSNLVRDSQGVREAVRRFRITFEAASAQIKMLKAYKSLHDSLHTLQYQCYDPIVAELRDYPDDPRAKERLIDPEEALRDTIGAIEARETQWRKYDLKTDLLLADLRAAERELTAALTLDDKKRLARSAVILGRVLNRYPAQINVRLLEAARALRLPSLIGAMSDVRVRLRDLGVARRQVRQFVDGVKSLTALDAQLRALLYEHDQWQTADVEMRLIDIYAEDFVADLMDTWPRLKVITEVLFSENPEMWAVRFKGDSERLGSDLDAGDLPKVRSSFRRYRRAAGIRFFDVDVSLLALCSSLQEVGAPLDRVLRLLDPEAEVGDEDESEDGGEGGDAQG